MMGFSRVFALLVLASSAALAQPKPEPTQKQKDKIQELAKRAISKSQAGDHEGAVKDLLEAYAIAPAIAVVLLSNVGYEYKQMKKPFEALKYFCMYLEMEPTGSAATYVKAEAASVTKELKLNGEACVKKEEIKPPDPKPDPPPDLNHGQVTGTVNIEPVPAEHSSPVKYVGIGVAAAGAVALGLGIRFGLQAKDKGDQITAGPPLDANGVQVGWGPNAELGWDGIAKLQSDGKSLQTKQIIFTASGSAMIVGGAVLYYVSRNKKTTETTIAPTAGPGSAGVSLSGSF